MTDEQINKLAREYVKEVYDGDTDFIDEAENIIQWLSKTHCIVDKEKIKEWSEKSELVAFDTIDLIEIFDDLFGKELFNVKEE